MNEQFNQLVDNLKKKNQQVADRSSSLNDQQVLIKSLDAVQNAIIQSISVLLTSLLEETLSTQVTNQKDFPKEIATPDSIKAAKEIKQALKDLETTLKPNQVDLEPVLSHLQGVQELLRKIPTKYPDFPEMPREVAINNLDSIVNELQELAIKFDELKLDPKITVEAPKVDLSKEIKAIEKAVKSIKPEVILPDYPEFDTSDLKKAINDVSKTIKELKFPVPNFKTQPIVDVINKLRGFDIPEFDEVDLERTDDLVMAIDYKKEDNVVARLEFQRDDDKIVNIKLI
jgi:hypothetical protein